MGSVIGVDEAGRGPVIGSMFVAGVAVQSPSVLPAGVRDSKGIPAAERSDLAGAIESKATIRTIVIEVPAERIDEASGRLNQLTAEAAANAIEPLLPSDPADLRIIVDACDTDAQRYSSRVQQGLPTGFEIEAEHRADEQYRSVAAASIIAKEARERHIGELCETVGNCGSGYPSDPTTRAFLANYLDEHGVFPPCARKTWKTCADLRAAADQGRLTNF